MPDLPNVFNRIDFIGILSPGYVAVLLWLVIYQSEYLLGSKALSYDILSAVIFIVAGPAVGLTLLRIHHGIASIYHHFPLLIEAIYRAHRASLSSLKRYNFFKNRYEYLKKRCNDDRKERNEYARVRLSLKGDQRIELDLPEAITNFEASLGVALVGIVAFAPWMPSPVISWYVLAALLFVGVAFFVGAWLNYNVYWRPVYKVLLNDLSQDLN